MKRINFTITPSSISVVLQGRPRQLNNTHMNFLAVREALKQLDQARLAGDEEAHTILLDKLHQFVDVPTFIAIVTEGRVQVGKDGVRFDGKPLSGHFTDRLIGLLSEGFDVRPLARMLDRLDKAPVADAKDGFLRWLEKSNMPLCEDGCFIAYKYVRADYMDGFSGRINNAIGAVIPRLEVDGVNTDRNQTCAESGYHFCSFGYLCGQQPRVMLVKIAPEDVASFPDSEAAKGRCLFYEIVDEVPASELGRREVEDRPVYGASPSAFPIQDWDEQEDADEEDDGSEEEEGESLNPQANVATPQRAPRSQKKGGGLTGKQRWLARLAATKVSGKKLTEASIKVLVAKHGQREVSRRTGIPRSTLQGNLPKE
jgi:hypothetical protein